MGYKPYCEPKTQRPNPYGDPTGQPVAAAVDEAPPKKKRAKIKGK